MTDVTTGNTGSSHPNEPAASPEPHLSVMSEAERHRILIEWNNTQAAFSRDLCIHQLFEAQAQRTPGAVAAICDGQQLTYQELNEEANQLAHHLKTLGVGPGVMVAIYMERSLDILPALLGVLKAGGAYVPLETSFPQARIQWILSSLRIPIIITHRAYPLALPTAEQVPALAHILCLDSTEPLRANQESSRCIWTRSQLQLLPRANLPLQASPQDIAYIIFTSGSTGTPKGVVVTHQPVINLIEWVNTTFHVQATDRLLFVTSLCFDLSVYDIFGLLAAGGSIQIATDQDVRDPERLLTLLCHEPITFWDSAPAALQQLVPFFPATPHAPSMDNLRLVFLSGDWIPIKLPDAIRRVFTHAQVISLGGATEAIIWSNFYPIGAVDPGWVSIPYGKPIQNAWYYILDDQLHPCPVGIAGDLYIGGLCLSIGYIHEPGLTAEKFIPDPFSGEAGARLYKTGDLARFWPDGTIEFLGRIDHQVKVRGFRIELGEIEAVLSQHPALQDTIVIAREYGEREKRLVAYLVPDQQQAFPVRQLLRFEKTGLLADKQMYELPNGMVISHQNRSETDFLYHELFEEQAGLKYGIRLREGDCIFDVGAHIGLFSLFVGQVCKDTQIYAFEPIPAVFELLRLNTALYGLDAKLFECGLARESETCTFTYYPHVSILSGRFADAEVEREIVKAFLLNSQEQNSVIADLSDEQLDELLEERLQSVQIPCQVKTLSQVIREHQVERIDLLKIDVEKSEHDVLAGIDEQDWPKIRQILVEVSDIDNRLEQITVLLERHGFELVIEQESSLKNTHLYTIYALQQTAAFAQDGREPVLAAEVRHAWCSKTALIDDVRTFLKERLPEYMIPSAFILLDAIPLTPNGKVDKGALPEPAQEASRSDSNYTAPRTDLEETLANIWASVLGVGRVGVSHNFFDLGGHSLLATQVITRVRDIYQVDLPLPTLFQAPTIAELAKIIETYRDLRQDQGVFHVSPMARTGNYHPLSFPQEQVWFLQQLDPSNMAYTFQSTLKVTGPLDIPALEGSLSEIIRRHEIYRTTFEAVDGQPVQIIHEPWPVMLPIIDLLSTPVHERAEAVDGSVMREFQRPFDLTRLPLIRWSLLRLDIQEYILVHVEHHLVHDGWSFNTFLHELLTLYRAFSKKEPSPLPDLPVQFVHFVYWQRQWIQSAMAQRQLTYWKQQLLGSPPVLKLPTDRTRPTVQTFCGNAMRAELPPDLCNALRARCRQEGFTLFMTMLATFLTLLYRYSGQEDICLGTGIANRRSREAECLIGMIINTLVLRTNLSGNPTFRQLLTRVCEVTLGAYEHQDLPFEKVVEALQPERNLSYNPFFQVMFGFHDSPLDALELPGLDLELTEGQSNGSAKFDLNLILIPHAEQSVGRGHHEIRAGITMVWEYNTDLFDMSTIQRMMSSYQTLLESICVSTSQRITELPLLTAVERKLQLIEWNATSTPYPDDQSITQLFEAQVERSPEAMAVLFENGAVTYRQLNQQANQLAHYLRRLGVCPGNLVGLSMERSVDLIIAMLAILKVGAAYVPLDLDYPQERIAFMIQDAQMNFLLTQQSLRDLLPAHTATIICLDSEREAFAQERINNLPSSAEAADLAYVIYTSGSTGVPKGVAVPQQAVNRLVCDTNYIRIESTDRVAQASNTSFDAATFEVWGALLQGASLIGVSRDVALSPHAFAAYLREKEISIVFLTTALFNSIAQEVPNAFSSLRYLLFGGEAVDPRWVRTVLKHGGPQHLLHVYGPTENTTFSTWYQVQDVPEQAATIPIGYPIANTQAYVLNQQMQLVQVSVPGELYLGGDGLAQGYLRRPDLTAERFVPHPFSNVPGARLYRTGDLVRYLSDGAIEFIGRLDSQVKVRGFRVELGEIEVLLRQHPAVQDALVLLRTSPEGDKRLVSHVVPQPGATLSTQELRTFLKKQLPEYMLPASLIFLEAFPMTPNGKVDRKALLEHKAEQDARPRALATLRTPLEQSLGEIWAELLGLPQIDPHANFFELGGHSLLATRFVARVRAILQIELSLRVFFEHPTLTDLAAILESGVHDEAIPSVPAISPIPRRVPRS